MKRYSDRRMGTELSRSRRRTLWGLVLLAMVSARTAQANPIRHHQVSSRSTQELRAWNNFIAGGQSLWAGARTPKISDRIRALLVRSVQGADPSSDPNVQYLLWRQSLNPARFDHWH